jgi:hypothetical protein
VITQAFAWITEKGNLTTAPFSPSPSSNPEDAILLNNNLYSSFCNREVDRGRDRERGGKNNRERECREGECKKIQSFARWKNLCIDKNWRFRKENSYAR